MDEGYLAFMKNRLEEVTEKLLKGSEKIDRDYFLLPFAGIEHPKYRELVYAYELYHQWRSQGDLSEGFLLNGEIDKKGHLYIDPKIPDFLVHRPGYMDLNLLVMEVKAFKGEYEDWDILWGEYLKDLVKLTYFRSKIGIEKPDRIPEWDYYAAYFWIYGMSKEKWDMIKAKFKEKIVKKNEEEAGSIDTGLIQVFVHPGPRKSAIEVGW